MSHRLAKHQRINPYSSEGKLPKSGSSHIVRNYYTDSEVERAENVADKVFAIIPKKYHPEKVDYNTDPLYLRSDNDPPSELERKGYLYSPEIDRVDLDNHIYYDSENEAKLHSLGGHLKMTHDLLKSLSDTPDKSLGPYHDNFIDENTNHVYRDKLLDFLHFQAPKLMHQFLETHNIPINSEKRIKQIKKDYLDFLEDHVYENPLVADYIEVLKKDE